MSTEGWSAAVSTASTASTEHPASSSAVVGTDELKVVPIRYLELRDGWEFCSLCKRYATHGHLESENHKYRVEMTEWEAQWKGECDNEGAPLEGPPKWWGNPKFYEWKDGWRWWCRICHQWAEGGHVTGNRHVKRAAWFDWNPDQFDVWADGAEDPDDFVNERRGRQGPPALDPWGPEWEPAPSQSPSHWYEAWSEKYDRPYYYNMKTLEQSWDMPAEGLAARSALPTKPMGTSQRKGAEVVPPPWSKEWSEEHQRHFYWNKRTNESRWVLPDWADDWDS